MSDKNLRDEITELAEAVRELRDREVADTLRDLRAEVEKLRAEREAHYCHGCTCTHIHWTTYPVIQCAPAYPQVWYGTVTTGTSGYTTTNTAACNPAITTFGIDN